MDRNALPSPSERRADIPHLALPIVLMTAGIYVALFAAWHIREALLLAFASVVAAVLLLALAEPIERRAGLSRTWSLTLVGVLILVALAGLFWLLGAQLRSQISQLINQLPEAIKSAEQALGITLLDQGGGRAQGGDGIGMGLKGIGSAISSLFGSLVSLGTGIAGALTSLALIVVGSFFLAASPGLYRRGLVKLFPKGQHGRVDDALGASGRALRLWLFAQLLSMTVVGVLVGLGTWLIGLPAPLALGLLAGLLEFIPLIGSILGAVPALLLALPQGGGALLWTLLLFIAVQQLESNIIMPLVERRMVEIPPALLLFAVLAVGLLFGALGVIIAAPLTVVLYVLVKKLYLRQTLGEETEVPGEAHG